jgi:hypothetical protein
LLVERASQVFGVAEDVIARAARLSPAGDAGGGAIATVVRGERRRGSDLERRLLRGLLAAPGLWDEVRGELRLDDFEDGDARALAAWWWEHGVVVPFGEGADGAAALARELASEEEQLGDHRAEVLGATRRLVVRRLQRELRAKQSGLATARGEEATRLMQEIQDTARALRERST